MMSPCSHRQQVAVRALYLCRHSCLLAITVQHMLSHMGGWCSCLGVPDDLLPDSRLPQVQATKHEQVLHMPFVSMQFYLREALADV